MRILVTNDDGIDSVGLHVLTRAICAIPGGHEVIVVAPDVEYSGASAAVGTLYRARHRAHRARIDHCPTDEVWTLNGPPALCVMFARLGAFGAPPELVVSGINPGANVGRSVYHSGTIGAALTGRIGHVSGIAVSQSVTGFGVEGQSWDEAIENQQWDSAATIGAAVAAALMDDVPDEPVVVNLNVPNAPIEEIDGWRETTVSTLPTRAIADARLEPIAGHEGAFEVMMTASDRIEQPPDTDTGAVERNEVSISYLSRIIHEPRPDVTAPARALRRLLP